MKGTKVAAKVIAPIAKQVLPQLGEQAGMALGTYASKSPLGGVVGAQFGKHLGDQASDALSSYGNGFQPVGSGFRPAGRSMMGTGIATLRPDYPNGYSEILPINHQIYNSVPVRLKFGM